MSDSPKLPTNLDDFQTEQATNAENFARKSQNYVFKILTFVQSRPIVSVICVLLILNLFHHSNSKPEPTNADQNVVGQSEPASQNDVTSPTVDENVKVKRSPKVKEEASFTEDAQTVADTMQNRNANVDNRVDSLQTDEIVFDDEEPEDEQSELVSQVVEEPETTEEKIHRLLTTFYDLSIDEKERKEAQEELEWMRNDEETAELVDDAESVFLVKDFKEAPNAETVPDGTILECSTHEELLRQNHKTIKKLILTGSSIDSHAFALLQRTPHLQELSLRNVKTAHKAYGYLKSCVNLTSLEIVGGNFGDEDLKYIADLPNLKTLDVSKANVSVACLETFPDYKNIDNFIFPDSFNSSVEARVKLLNVKSNRSENIDLSGLAVTDSILMSLDPRSDIKTLKLSNANISSRSFAHIAKFEGLNELDLSNTSINNHDAEALNDLLATLRLKSLSLEGCESFDQDGLEALTNGASLEALYFPNVPLAPEKEYFKVLKEALLKGIEKNGVLNLSGSQLDDACLEQFASLEEITQISLANCPNVTCEQLSNFKACSNVKTLDLSKTNVSDAVLKNLVEKYASLNTLILQGCSQLTDQSIRSIPDYENLDLREIPQLTFSGLLPHYRVNNLLFDDVKERRNVINALHKGELTSISTNSQKGYEDLSAQDVAVIASDVKAQETVKSVDLAESSFPLEILNVLPQFKNLQDLSLTSCRTLQDAALDEARLALERVVLLENLKSLDISDWNAPVDVLEPLTKHQKLSSLSFPESYRNDAGFVYYHSIPQLQNNTVEVDLAYWNATGSSVKFAAENLKRLRSLIANDQIVDFDLIPLAQSNTLTTLDLTACSQITKRGVFVALDIPCLSKLSLTSAFEKYRPILEAALASNFASVEFEDASEITDEALEILTAPRFKRSLQTLRLEHAKYLLDKATTYIAELSELKSLTLTYARTYSNDRVYGVTNESLQKLSALHNLVSLDIQGLHPDNENSGLEFLKGMPKLQNLNGALIDSVEEFACISGTSISEVRFFALNAKLRSQDAAPIMKYLGQMKHLETLVISDPGHKFVHSAGEFARGLGVKGLAPLANAPELRNLQLALDPNKSQQLDFSVLKDCKNLEELACVVQSKQNVRQIAEIKTLKRLGFFTDYNVSWEDADFKPLLSLSKLEVIALGNATLTIDPQTEILYQFPNLKVVQAADFDGAPVSIQKFKDKFEAHETYERGRGNGNFLYYLEERR